MCFSADRRRTGSGLRLCPTGLLSEPWGDSGEPGPGGEDRAPPPAPRTPAGSQAQPAVPGRAGQAAPGLPAGRPGKRAARSAANAREKGPPAGWVMGSYPCPASPSEGGSRVSNI